MKQSVCCAIAEHSAVNSCAACILQMTVNGATRPSFHLRLVQDIGAGRGHFRNQDY
jgi:hypothetical protein